MPSRRPGLAPVRPPGTRGGSAFRSEGWSGLLERPSIPKHQPRRLSAKAEAEILAARERSNAGPQTLAALLERPASTIGRVLRRLGHSRFPRARRPPVMRYERERPGELVHIDTKKLDRFWHVGKRPPRRRATQPRRGLAARPRRRRRPFPARLCRGAVDGSPTRCARLPRAGPALVPGAGRGGRGGDDGQWARLRLARLAAALRRARAAPPPDPALCASHQLQRRAVHPAAAQALGLRLRLSHQPATHPRPGWLAPLVQPTQTDGSLGGLPPISRVSRVRG